MNILIYSYLCDCNTYGIFETSEYYADSTYATTYV